MVTAADIPTSYGKFSVVPSVKEFPGLDSIFTRSERALFVNKSSRLLFILEYIVLGEYVEVVLLIIYCKGGSRTEYMYCMMPTI